MAIKKEMREVTIQRCDGCGRELGHETIYGYGTGVELGECCFKELREFEFHKMRARSAIDEIKAQPFYSPNA